MQHQLIKGTTWLKFFATIFICSIAYVLVVTAAHDVAFCHAFWMGLATEKSYCLNAIAYMPDAIVARFLGGWLAFGIVFASLTGVTSAVMYLVYRYWAHRRAQSKGSTLRICEMLDLVNWRRIASDGGVAQGVRLVGNDHAHA
jgi:hypothetical protein